MKTLCLPLAIALCASAGAQTFGSQNVLTPTAASPQFVCTADVDGDGDQDVLSASEDDDKIALYENLGGGAFVTQRVISTAADGPWWGGRAPGALTTRSQRT